MGPVRDWSPREEPPGRGGGYEQKLTSEYPAVDCRRKEVLVRVPGCSFSGRLRGVFCACKGTWRGRHGGDFSHLSAGDLDFLQMSLCFILKGQLQEQKPLCLQSLRQHHLWHQQLCREGRSLEGLLQESRRQKMTWHLCRDSQQPCRVNQLVLHILPLLLPLLLPLFLLLLLTLFLILPLLLKSVFAPDTLPAPASAASTVPAPIPAPAPATASAPLPVPTPAIVLPLSLFLSPALPQSLPLALLLPVCVITPAPALGPVLALPLPNTPAECFFHSPFVLSFCYNSTIILSFCVLYSLYY